MAVETSGAHNGFTSAVSPLVSSSIEWLDAAFINLILWIDKVGTFIVKQIEDMLASRRNAARAQTNKMDNDTATFDLSGGVSNREGTNGFVNSIAVPVAHRSSDRSFRRRERANRVKMELREEIRSPPHINHRYCSMTVHTSDGDARALPVSEARVRMALPVSEAHVRAKMEDYVEDPLPRQPTTDEMNACFQMCRGNQWHSVLNSVKSNPLIPVTSMIMDNHISTTILHQAITSKGDTKARSRVIQEILDVAPGAASIKNGYGSLPLHVIAQRNTKMDATTKEMLIRMLVSADRTALVQQGGVGMRTPLHIIFTDYISPRLTKVMIQAGAQACFMKDRKGYLPAHVACSRHCSPEKLQLLLNANPASLFATTNDGHTLLSLATSTATKSHPNYALIDDLRNRLDFAGTQQGRQLRMPTSIRGGDIHTVPNRVSSEETTDYADSASDGSPANRGICVAAATAPAPAPATRSRKRKIASDEEGNHRAPDDKEQAHLLLHFYRQTDQEIGDQEIKNITRV